MSNGKLALRLLKSYFLGIRPFKIEYYNDPFLRDLRTKQYTRVRDKWNNFSSRSFASSYSEGKVLKINQWGGKYIKMTLL